MLAEILFQCSENIADLFAIATGTEDKLVFLTPKNNNWDGTFFIERDRVEERLFFIQRVDRKDKD